MATTPPITFDPNNANRGTQRGRGLLEQTMRKHGARRSGVADRNGVMVAGNKSAEVAAEIGLEFEVIKADPHKYTILQYDDLDINEPDTKEIAVADNRIGEVSLDWDAAVLAALADEVDLSGMWREDELADLMIGASQPPSLDSLSQQYGESQEEDFWPEIRVKVSPDTLEQYESLMRQIPGANDAERFQMLLDAVNVAVLGTVVS